ncbi:PrgI family protein [Candidatus Saccharibacteria bacterium]|nr:PrgI family protein [Candidatus Saccharibacteria bacterium]
MAEHKVPQDVEAEDKLLGPLSFRQFIYAMIALAGVALAYFMAVNITPLLVIVPLPIIIVFGILAIPRKGQPMEIYIGALIHFYLYPTKRIWNSDGQESLVEITNPTIDTTPLTKDISSAEATQRLSFLADVVDTQGWSTRGNVNLNDDYALAANTAADVFDDASLNKEFSAKLAEAEQRVRDKVISHMNTPSSVGQSSFAPPARTAATTSTIVTPPPAPPMPIEDEAELSAMLKQSAANNAVTTFKQTVIQPPSSSSVTSDPTLTIATTPPEPAIIEESTDTTSADTRAVASREVKIDDDQGGEISLR